MSKDKGQSKSSYNTKIAKNGVFTCKTFAILGLLASLGCMVMAGHVAEGFGPIQFTLSGIAVLISVLLWACARIIKLLDATL